MREFYRHYRLHDPAGGCIFDLRPRGGVTLFVRLADAGEGSSTGVVGTATCSLKENYCRRTGRKIARQRADSKAMSYRFTEIDYKVDDELYAAAWCAAHDVYGRRFMKRIELLPTGGKL